MSTAPPSSPASNKSSTIARRRWDANVLANLAALETSQPEIARVLRVEPPALTPVFGRDGSLTATLDPDAQWLTGCSLPDRAARHMLRKLQIGGVVACFIEPLHAAQVRAALDRLEPRQAIVAVAPETMVVQQMIGCCDFSLDIGAHRLFFAAGPAWAAEMEALFFRYPGLPTPQQFIRLPSADNAHLEPFMLQAQAVFARAHAARAASLAYYRESWRAPAGQARRVCLLAGSQFTLWDDAGAAMARTLQVDADTPVGFHRLDVDDPSSASAVALASAATACDVVLSADRSRGEMPGVLPAELPWITWVTRGGIAPFSAAGPRDLLLLADAAWRADAAKAGWPADRLITANWPRPMRDVAAEPGRYVALIADTQPIAADPQVQAYSSHQLLWDAIARELESNPFALADAPAAYLERRMMGMGIADPALDREKFIARLIIPAYQQGIARALLRAGAPLQLAGRGWEQLPEFQAHHAGPILTRGDLDRALAGPAALLHAWPCPAAHAMDAAAVAQIRTFGVSEREVMRRIADALAGRGNTPAAPSQPLSIALIEQILAYL